MINKNGDKQAVPCSEVCDKAQAMLCCSEKLPSIPLASDEDRQKFLNITRDKYYTMVNESQPLFCWFSLTEECDLRCKYCFADSTKPLEHELSTRECYQVLDNIEESGTTAVLFGGGECTLREDLLQIVDYAANKKGLFVGINTHGHKLVDRLFVQSLKLAGVSQIKIAVDGLQESHDWNRGKGAYAKCMQALQNCVDVGIESVQAIATISKKNHAEVPEMIKRDMEMGITSAQFPLLPVGRGKQCKDLMLSKEELRDWQQYMFEQQKIHGVYSIQTEDRYQITEAKGALMVAANPDRNQGYGDTPAGCICGIWSYAISADGKAYIGCTITPELEICNLKEQKLSDVWHNSELIKLMRDRDQLKGKCGRCEYRFVCGGCRRMTFAETGDLKAEDPACWYKPLMKSRVGVEP